MKNRSIRLAARLGLLTGCMMGLGLMQGCIVGAAIGGMAESARRTGTTKVAADYTGLRGKSYAVVVVVDRLTQAQHPGLVARLTSGINERLALPENGVGASAFIPSADLLAVLYETPQWPAMPPGEVADMLGVERLIMVELYQYSLYEPGNRYVWDGVASGSVTVYESDSGIPDDPIYEQPIRVTFPDGTGFMAADIPEAGGTSELSRRFINRAAWLFYDHEEPNTIAY